MQINRVWFTWGILENPCAYTLTHVWGHRSLINDMLLPSHIPLYFVTNQFSVVFCTVAEDFVLIHKEPGEPIGNEEFLPYLTWDSSWSCRLVSCPPTLRLSVRKQSPQREPRKFQFSPLCLGTRSYLHRWSLSVGIVRGKCSLSEHT